MIDTPDTFLADFGVDVSGPGATTGVGILDQPDAVFGDGMPILSTEYALTVKTSAFPNLKSGDQLTVAGTGYTVRVAQKIDDGSFTRVLMTKGS